MATTDGTSQTKQALLINSLIEQAQNFPCIFPLEEVKQIIETSPDGFLFVHDHGVYLMPISGGKVVYAYGMNPDVDAFEDWWETSRLAVGGDDFGESILFAETPNLLKGITSDNDKYTFLVIECNDTEMSIGLA